METIKNKFQKNQQIQLIGKPDRVGVVIDIKALERTCIYTVFFSATDIKDILEQDLALPGYQPSSIVEKIYAKDFLDSKHFQAVLTSKKIKVPLTSNIYSYLASRTRFHALQFKPLLKFLNSNYHRILISDEVGVGKTIEAGIIYTEMKARLKGLDKVLIICPSYLLQRKWQDEMYSRFDEDFEILNGQEFKSRLDDWQNQTRFRGIISLPLLRRHDYIDVLTQTKPDFDLIIIDEAHHFRNDNTNTFALGELLSSLTNCMIFLTATPIHISNKNLFNLLYLLAPQEFANETVFHLMMEPNKYINTAISHIKCGEYKEARITLEKINELSLRERFLKNPIYEEVLSMLYDSSAITRDKQIKLISNLHDLNTLSHIVTRTKKKDFPYEFPVREPYVINVKLDQKELAFYDAVYEYAKRRAKRLSESGYELPFLTIMIRRRAASCLPALFAYFRKILALRKLLYDDEEIEEEGSEYSPYTKKEIENCSNLSDEDIEDIKSLVSIGSQIGTIDTKYSMFLQSINKLYNQGVKKILVFSFFRGTLNYLKRKLIDADLDIDIGIIHGDIPVEEREKIIDKFKLTPDNTILLSSEVGGEGLDLQFCQCMINYDLPWNPMIVEQRIGRLDRYGQIYKKIMIYNFSVRETIEQTILERLYDRINIFRESLGDLEEILGEELSDLRNSIFNPELTKSQVEAELERIADSIVLKQNLNKKFDEERDKILGQDTYFTEQITKIGDDKKFITGEELENLYAYFISTHHPASKFNKRGKNSAEWLLKPDLSLREFLTNHIRNQSPGKKERMLMAKIGATDGLRLTFSSDVACATKDIEFASFCHPITKAILSKYWHSLSHKFVSCLKCQSMDVNPGIYFFILFMIKTSGYTEYLDFFPVVINSKSHTVDKDLSDKFMCLEFNDALNDLDCLKIEDLEGLNRVALEHLQNHCSQLRDTLETKNQRLIDIRMSSLQQTYEILINQIEDFIKNQADHRILRMKESQKENLLAKREKQLAELNSKRTVSIEFEEIAGGLLAINM